MDIKRLVIGTIAGGATLFVIGYLIFDLATASFYTDRLIDVDSAYRDAHLHWMQALGNLALGGLVTLGIMSRTPAPTVAGGFAIGAVIGFLVWLGADLTLVSLTNVWNPIIPLIDPLLEAIHHGSAGAVIAAVLLRIPKDSRARTA